MRLSNKIVVVTGGGTGIGRALCRRFAAEGARMVVVSDMNVATATQVASEVDGVAVEADVSREADVVRLVKQVTDECGAIDLFCSNAGIFAHGSEETSDADWRRTLDVNVMAHVFAARALLRRRCSPGAKATCCKRYRRPDY